MKRPETGGRRRESGVHLNISVQERKLSFTQLVPGLETRQESWFLDLEVNSKEDAHKQTPYYRTRSMRRRKTEGGMTWTR